MSRLEVVWSPTGSVFEGEGELLASLRESFFQFVGF